MELVLDTSVLIAVERNIVDFDSIKRYGNIYICSITVAELLFGVYRADNEDRKVKRSASVEHMISSIPILHFGEAEARIYAQIFCELKDKGLTVGAHDLMIGATAIAAGCKVLTMNEKDFRRISGLDVLSIV